MFEGQQLTYAQLNARANQLAHHLQALGVGPEMPVAICMEHCPEMVVGVLGILKAGGAYLPLDPASPKERLAFMLQDAARARAADAETIGWRACPIMRDASCAWIPSWEVIAAESDENPVSGATAQSLAYVIYTSGSTGQPKGVMCEHGGLVNYLRWVNEGPLGDPDSACP